MHPRTSRPRGARLGRAMLGLMVLLLVAQAQAQQSAPAVQPVDCANPVRSDEKAICANDELKKLDAQIAELDNKLLALLPGNDEMARRDVRNSRYRFVKFRRLCSMDLACQMRAHEHRLKWLKEQLAMRQGNRKGK